MAAIYESVVSYLADKEVESVGMPLADMPEKLRDPKVLAAAWAAGIIEFGRCQHSIAGATNDNSSDNRRHREEYRLDAGYSWSGGKKNTHKPFRDLLAEDKPIRDGGLIPDKVYEVEKIEDRSTNPPTYKIKRTEHPGSILKLRIRLTDKGMASLGVAV